MEQKLVHVQFPLELKADDDLIVGYANKAIVDDGGDLIEADVWFSALQTFFREGMPIKLLHRPKLTVGETVSLKIDKDGLWLASRPLLPEVKGLIERGLLTAYSIGYVPREYIKTGEGRKITALDLYEVSYVDEPMNPGSYFGGKAMPLRETHEIVFDAESGMVTVMGLNAAEMASLAKLIEAGLEQAGVVDPAGIRSIAFKMADESKAEWTTAYINSLPDSSFAVIEPAYKRGETKDKRARHLPHHGPGGGGTQNANLDLPHLRNAFARANQIKPITDSISAEELQRQALAHLEHHRDALKGGKADTTEVQTVICSKERFESAEEARTWCREHDFRVDKVDETEDSYRFRQFDPSRCQEDTFRTITLTEGVKAVICRPVKETDSKADKDGGNSEVRHLLRQIWDSLRCANKSTDDAHRSVMNVFDTQKDAAVPEQAGQVTQAEEKDTSKTDLSELREQVKAWGAESGELKSTISGLQTDITELKETVGQLVSIIKELVPPSTSLPVNDTTDGKQQKKYKWGLFGPTN